MNNYTVQNVCMYNNCMETSKNYKICPSLFNRLKEKTEKKFFFNETRRAWKAELRNRKLI